MKIFPAAMAMLVLPLGVGAPLTVCVEDQDSLLAVPVRGAMTKELLRLVGDRVDGPQFGNCAGGWSEIAMTILDEPPSGLEDVLALAYREGGRIQPRLVVFRGSLYRHAGRPGAGEALGRSLARVAVHEVLHFLDRRHRHCEAGLMKAKLSAHELTAPGLWSARQQSTSCGSGQ